MLIDDDYNINNLSKFFFEKEGYSVDSFTDYIEALNLFRKDEYNLVVLNSKTPKLNEVSLYQKFQEIDNNVPICLTKSDMESLEEIKKQIQKMDNNIRCQSLSLDDNESKLDFFC
jgi:DNA-binding response OmpR family regulator